MSVEDQIINCESRIDSNNEQIQRYERLYDSLIQFKGDVSESQGQFTCINSSKKNLISSLENYTAESQIAKNYSFGMEKVLNGVGVLYVNCTYNALLFSIELKLAEYNKRIRDLESSNNILNFHLDMLYEKLNAESVNDQP